MSSTYTARETSQRDGQPIEAYEFKGPGKFYRYTSADVALTIRGSLYEPIVVRRTAIRAGTHNEDSLDLEVRMPVDVALIKDYAFDIPPAGLTLTVYRGHLGTDMTSDFVVYWTGDVTGIKIDGHEARVRVPSVFGALLGGELPSVYYQAPCNHVLYDSRCKVDRSANTVTTQVVSGGGLELIVASAGGRPNGFFLGGEARLASGERRMIVGHSGTSLALNFPFSDVKIGQVVEVSAGCDHSGATCKAKFNNKANFGGFEYIPSINPFAEGL